ncbi:MAG TPA: hypothetical protein VFS23_26680 [Vicinamibacterales bacterium]|nr:hypothetical protein [Vicinamibacterales bacterium]
MAPHRWRSARVLDAVCQVNEHLVSALSELARLGDVASVVVERNLDVLRRMDAAACKRTARIPVLLLNLNFQSSDWWRRAATLNGGPWPTTKASANRLPVALAVELTRESLIVAWLAVRDSAQSAAMLFGMSDEVARLLGEMSAQQLDRIAARESHELRVRWHDNTEFWEQILEAGKTGNAERLCEAHLFGLQLLGGELLSLR